MKATDVRIGNYVFDEETPHYFQIEEIRKYVGYELWVYYRNGSIKTKDPEPIKLTEEWLIKFGFEKIKNYKNVLDEVEFIKTHNKPSKNIYLRFFGTDSTVFNHSECEPEQIQYISTVVYVHQLQNLYYALTGEELEIKQ